MNAESFSWRRRVILLASVALILPAMTHAATAPHKLKALDGCSVQSSDFVVEQGRRTVTIDYAVDGGVCPSTTYGECLDPPLCYQYAPEHLIDYPTVSITFTLSDSGGHVLSRTTVTPVRTIYPSDGQGNPTQPPRPPRVREERSIPVDVSALTASGPATVRFTVEGCSAGGGSCGTACAVAGCSPNVSAGIGLLPEELTFAFDVPSTEPPQKVLTHKYGSDDAYPLGSRQLSVPATARPQVVIKGVVSSNGTGVEREVFFRLFDPPDRADYVPANDRVNGDNADVNMRAGRLYVQDAAGNFLLDAAGARITNDAAGVLRTASRTDGGVTLVLETTDRYAGDNYQIETSFDRATEFDSLGTTEPCASCVKSAVYETWKRIYIERDRMFRHGAFVASRAAAGATEVFVDGLANLGQPGQILTVRLIHAPPSIPVAGARGPGALTDFFYEEDHQVQIVPGQFAADGTFVDEHLSLRAGDAVINTFDRDPAYNRFDAAGQSILRDGVGVITGNDAVDFFEADMGGSNLPTSQVGTFWATAFVDLQLAPGRVGSVPLAEIVPRFVTLTTNTGSLQISATRALADKWFLNGIGRPGDAERRAPENLQHMVGGDRLYSPFAIAETQVGEGGNSTFIGVGAVERRITQPSDEYSGLNLAETVIETIVHEQAHQWRVNQPPPPGGNWGHCASTGYRRDGTFCRMHIPFAGHVSERADGNIQFHYDRTQSPNGVVTVDGEYLTVRNAIEPVPNQ